MREIDVIDDELLEQLNDNDDIYARELQEELLDDDEIELREEAFLRGYGSV